MTKLTDSLKVLYNNSTYAVMGMKYKDTTVPVILDWNDYEAIEKFDKNWHINDKGMVVTSHKITANNQDYTKEIYMHDIVMRLSKKNYDHPILHINRLGVDNRRNNLMHDILKKDTTKNIKKKDRIINLTGSGIVSNELPSYVWYLKDSDSHGERFMISIGDIKWKSSSSKHLSLRYKLEETKKYLRHLKKSRSDLFLNYSMNGDLNEKGKQKLNSYIAISKQTGFNNIKNIVNKTDSYISEDHNGLSNNEISMLNSFSPTIM